MYIPEGRDVLWRKGSQTFNFKGHLDEKASYKLLTGGKMGRNFAKKLC